MINMCEVELDTSEHLEIPRNMARHLISGDPGSEQTEQEIDIQRPSVQIEEQDLIYLDAGAQMLACLSLGFNPVNGEKLKEGPWSNIPVAQKVIDLMTSILSSQGVDVSACLQAAKNSIQENTVEVEQSPKAKRWNKVEDDLLKEEVASGLSCLEIAQAHQRSTDSIEQRVKKLSLQWPVRAASVHKDVLVDLPVVPSAKNLDLFDTLISPSVSRTEDISPKKADLLEKIPEDFIESLAAENQKVLQGLEQEWNSK